MGKFLESEKIEQIAFKESSPTFSDSARVDGIFMKKPRPFCLPLDYSDQNLFPDIRESAVEHFSRHAIKWHNGHNGKPSNHLCDSMVCGVNFLFPFFNNPSRLAKLLSPFYPELETMLPVESGQYVSFEWIGARNYLGERVTRNGHRSRGANCTSTDAIVMFKRRDEKKQVVLIEWKYTESYGSTSYKIARSGTDRRTIYSHLFESPDCPINKEILPNYDALFYEPFYQFMRQQFLANEMEKAHDLDADIVSLLHIAPAHNKDFRKITSPELTSLGTSATDVWTELVMGENRFLSLSTEELFGGLTVDDLPEMANWLEYIHSRYRWVRES
ncbi:hypothetical protein ACFLXB_04105 [Chloroflexota bacterium]